MGHVRGLVPMAIPVYVEALLLLPPHTHRDSLGRGAAVRWTTRRDASLENGTHLPLITLHVKAILIKELCLASHCRGGIQYNNF